MIVRAVVRNDASQIAEIYNHYILTSHATFELETIDEVEMNKRIGDTVDLGYPFFVAADGHRICGYAYARPFRPRPGYRFAAEIAAYVKHNDQQRGVGRQLYNGLIPQLFNDGFHSLIATIALPNDASVRLHESFGFEKAGHFREVGRKFDRWVDVGYWQLLRQND
jgi:L-amino acid N-acyltransferase YncA